MLCISIAPKVIDENSWCVYTGLESSVLQMGAKDHLLSFGAVGSNPCYVYNICLSSSGENAISKPSSYNLALRDDKINLVFLMFTPTNQTLFCIYVH